MFILWFPAKQMLPLGMLIPRVCCKHLITIYFITCETECITDLSLCWPFLKRTRLLTFCRWLCSASRPVCGLWFVLTFNLLLVGNVIRTNPPTEYRWIKTTTLTLISFPSISHPVKVVVYFYSDPLVCISLFCSLWADFITSSDMLPFHVGPRSSVWCIFRLIPVSLRVWLSATNGHCNGHFNVAASVGLCLRRRPCR